MKKVLLFGCGWMGLEYYKVIKRLNKEIIVFGRGSKSASKFKSLTNQEVRFETPKTISKIYDRNSKIIVSVGINDLYPLVKELIKNGFRDILVEKPLATELKEILELSNLAKENNALLSLAFNRRFYPSIITLKKIFLNEKLLSFRFSFTEWFDSITESIHKPEIIKKWGICNSIHILDTVFSIGGLPKKLNCSNNFPIAKHPSGLIFTGSGETKNDIPFSYHSNWASQGRWEMEFFTAKGSYQLCPIEELSFIPKNSLKPQNIELIQEPNDLKVGLYNMLDAYLNNSKVNFCFIKDYEEAFITYKKILGYES